MKLLRAKYDPDVKKHNKQKVFSYLYNSWDTLIDTVDAEVNSSVIPKPEGVTLKEGLVQASALVTQSPYCAFNKEVEQTKSINVLSFNTFFIGHR
jgi:hypothetical protein